MAKMSPVQFTSVNQLIKSLDPTLQARAEAMRKAILSAAPGAEEVISYNMPAYKLNGILVWFTVYGRHTGFYPKPDAIKHFSQELHSYKTSKGAIQFPHDEP